MALLSSHSSVNLEESAAVMTRYLRAMQSQDFSVGEQSFTASYYEYHRITSGNYRYVGLTKDAALACANACRAALEHASISQVVVYQNGAVTVTDGGELSIMAGDISVTREAGSMWSVEVSLNEDVTLLSTERFATQEAMADFFDEKIGSDGWGYFPK